MLLSNIPVSQGIKDRFAERVRWDLERDVDAQPKIIKSFEDTLADIVIEVADDFYLLELEVDDNGELDSKCLFKCIEDAKQFAQNKVNYHANEKHPAGPIEWIGEFGYPTGYTECNQAWSAYLKTDDWKDLCKNEEARVNALPPGQRVRIYGEGWRQEQKNKFFANIRFPFGGREGSCKRFELTKLLVRADGSFGDDLGDDVLWEKVAHNKQVEWNSKAKATYQYDPDSQVRWLYGRLATLGEYFDPDWTTEQFQAVIDPHFTEEERNGGSYYYKSLLYEFYEIHLPEEQRNPKYNQYWVRKKLESLGEVYSPDLTPEQISALIYKHLGPAAKAAADKNTKFKVFPSEIVEPIDA